MSPNGAQKPPDPMKQPDPAVFDYKPVLESLRECRSRIRELMRETGRKTSLYVECESLLANIESVAHATRVPGATKFVKNADQP